MGTRIRYSEQIKDRATEVFVEALTVVGYQVALEAYRRKTYTNRTFNLHDSYGSAVFVDGHLIPESIRYVNRTRSKRADRSGRAPMGAKTGREALRRFLDNAWIVRKKDRVTLVVAASMWYGEHVESKGYEVLDEEFVESEISHRLSIVLPRILAKYPDLKGLEPMIRRWVGIDEVYYYDI